MAVVAIAVSAGHWQVCVVAVVGGVVCGCMCTFADADDVAAALMDSLSPAGVHGGRGDTECWAWGKRAGTYSGAFGIPRAVLRAVMMDPRVTGRRVWWWSPVGGGLGCVKCVGAAMSMRATWR